MKKLWLKILEYFKKPINIAMAITAIAFVVLCLIPISSDFYTKFKVWVLAILVGIAAYKIFVIYKAKKELLDTKSLSQQQTNLSDKINGRYEGLDIKTYLTCSIVLAIFAIIMIVYTFIK